jgi:hypothetical protein
MMRPTAIMMQRTFTTTPLCDWSMESKRHSPSSAAAKPTSFAIMAGFTELLQKMKSPLRILYLEDDPRDAELVQEALASNGIGCHAPHVSEQNS